ncbi:hypothetical protein [Streptomyces neyagawaensis]|uniref:hypothetical protein n=1 Tax=Streptomyces neyagawaensis TaxID=42238 RepID=UPI0006E2FD89|nr:hypothetical protein [Streptomyces neyagawaensis]MDE1686084.1 hypothetical protein [Streptomyces neyagawaensis]
MKGDLAAHVQQVPDPHERGATEVPVAEPVFLLAEGAIVTAGISGDPAPAHHARAAVAALLGAEPKEPADTA